MRWRFVARRLAMLVASLLVASFLIFAALYLAPGNPAASLSGGRPLPPAGMLHRGAVVERGPTAHVLDNPEHPRTQRLRASVPRSGWKPRRHVLPSNFHPSGWYSSGWSRSFRRGGATGFPGI